MQVRKLRNSCRDHLTNHRDHIGILQQAVWYIRHYHRARETAEYRLFLARNNEGLPVGYGALAEDAGRLLVTECVAPKYRGLGHGKWILNRLLDIAREENRDVVAEIWADNDRSIAMHEKAGFKLESGGDKEGRAIQTYLLPVTLIWSESETPKRSSAVAQGQHHYRGL